MGYIHELPNWPRFSWNDDELAPAVARLRHRQGRLVGRMEGLGYALRADANLRTLTEEIVKSSEIEGEILELAQVRSSLARQLGMDIAGLVPADRSVDGSSR